jgi:hypothetical protein
MVLDMPTLMHFTFWQGPVQSLSCTLGRPIMAQGICVWSIMHHLAWLVQVGHLAHMAFTSSYYCSSGPVSELSPQMQGHPRTSIGHHANVGQSSPKCAVLTERITLQSSGHNYL